MNILIVSNSLVVEELLKLVLKNKNYNLEYQKDVEDADRNGYDIIFIDESSQDLNSQIEYAQDGLKSKVVLIASADTDTRADYLVVKPFLPEDIEIVIDNIKEKNLKNNSTNVLDPEEIARIKEIMQLDDEIEDIQENIDCIELLRDKKSVKVKKKEAKELLLELSELNKKELKKLLKGAKVSIKIAYKKGKDE